MFEFICVTVAIIIILIATSFGIKNRNDMSKWISCVLLGIFFSAFFMV